MPVSIEFVTYNDVSDAACVVTELKLSLIPQIIALLEDHFCFIEKTKADIQRANFSVQFCDTTISIINNKKDLKPWLSQDQEDITSFIQAIDAQSRTPQPLLLGGFKKDQKRRIEAAVQKIYYVDVVNSCAVGVLSRVEPDQLIEVISRLQPDEPSAYQFIFTFYNCDQSLGITKSLRTEPSKTASWTKEEKKRFSSLVSLPDPAESKGDDSSDGDASKKQKIAPKEEIETTPEKLRQERMRKVSALFGECISVESAVESAICIAHDHDRHGLGKS